MILPFIACKKNVENIELKSPDNSYVFNLDVNKNLLYNVVWGNQIIVENSSLGFKLSDGAVIPGDVKVINVEKVSKNTEWTPLYGESSVYTDNYNEMLIHLSCADKDVKMALRVRAYNQGVAFRYEINSNKDLYVDKELTEFSYPGDVNVWVSKRAQSEITKQKISELSFISERPLLAELSDSLYASIGEAGLVDFARMKFKKSELKANTLVASLDKGENNNYPVIIPANGYNTPWRFVMAGKTPAQILQNNYLLLNLNEENKIKDTSFIKPGKVIRETTLTTRGGIACVDFAKKHNLQFIEFDAGWYGNEYDDASDATTVTVDPNRSKGTLDLQYVINYAKEKGIGVILYVNRRSLEKQIDDVLPLLKSWGVAGIKYGFVNVGPQKWTNWLHEAIRKAAAIGLMVDVHDEYRPTGYTRTYPNFMTQEGIRGDEEAPSNDAVINTVFTRMIAGAGDHTNCYFAERVAKMGSHASQMAKAICIYSPWQFLYWYDLPQGSVSKKYDKEAIPEIKDLKFYDELPTIWNKTKVMEGYPGKYVSIARKNGDKWYMGSLSGTENYNLSVKLDFLDSDTSYKATVYSDDKSLNTRTNVKILELTVNNQSVFSQNILKENGLAVVFTPIEK